MKNNAPNFRPVDNTVLTENYGYDKKLVPVYETIANKVINAMKTDTNFTPDNMVFEHRDVVKGITSNLKLDTINVEKMLATLATGNNPLIKIRRNPDNKDIVMITTTKNFWNYDNNIINK